eukprot:gene2502-3249_t
MVTGADEVQSRYGVNEEYCVSGQHNVGGKQVELVGMSKHQHKTANFAQLRMANLCGSAVFEAGDVKGCCPRLSELNIAQTQIKSWDTVVEIASQLRLLKWLDSSGLMLGPLPPVPCDTFPVLHTLILNQTGVTWEQVLQLGPSIPMLTELHLENNTITTLLVPGSDCAEQLPHLVTLNLSGATTTYRIRVLILCLLRVALHLALHAFPVLPLSAFSAWCHAPAPLAALKCQCLLPGNQLGSWSSVHPAGALPALTSLHVSNNLLADVPACEDGHFSSLTNLSLHGNKINEWRSVDALGSYRNLNHLRFSGIPLLHELPVAQARQQVLARLPSLKVANGSKVRPVEVSDAEKWYAKYCALQLMTKHQDFLNSHPRYPELVKLHGNPFEFKAGNCAATLGPTLTANISLMTLGGPKVGLKQPLVISLDWTVMMLKSTIQSIVDIPLAQQKLVAKMPADGGGDTPDWANPLDNDESDLGWYGLADGYVLE